MIGGFNDLLSYVVTAPEQDDAGSCLFMSHTGTLEWWMNRLKKNSGKNKINLSERYMMNLAKAKVGQSSIDNWRTDNIYRLNKNRIHYRNQSFPFTKSWWKRNEDGQRIGHAAGGDHPDQYSHPADGGGGLESQWLEVVLPWGPVYLPAEWRHWRTGLGLPGR